MTTFLKWLCEQLLGPPTHTEGGCPCWPCPACNHRSWHVRPPHPQHKDRFSCWRCLWWGDEADLVRWFHSGEDWPARRARLEQLRADYDREVATVGNGQGGTCGPGGVVV